MSFLTRFLYNECPKYILLQKAIFSTHTTGSKGSTAQTHRWCRGPTPPRPRFSTPLSSCLSRRSRVTDRWLMSREVGTVVSVTARPLRMRVASPLRRARTSRRVIPIFFTIKFNITRVFLPVLWVERICCLCRSRKSPAWGRHVATSLWQVSDGPHHPRDPRSGLSLVCRNLAFNLSFSQHQHYNHNTTIMNEPVTVQS